MQEDSTLALEAFKKDLELFIGNSYTLDYICLYPVRILASILNMNAHDNDKLFIVIKALVLPCFRVLWQVPSKHEFRHVVRARCIDAIKCYNYLSAACLVFRKLEIRWLCRDDPHIPIKCVMFGLLAGKDLIIIFSGFLFGLLDRQNM